MKIIKFCEGPSGEKSSKRLAGLCAAFVFLFLSLLGGFTFLQQGKAQEFLNLLDGLAFFSFGGLGMGIFDNLIKSKYAKTDNNSGNS